MNCGRLASRLAGPPMQPVRQRSGALNPMLSMKTLLELVPSPQAKVANAINKMCDQIVFALTASKCSLPKMHARLQKKMIEQSIRPYALHCFHSGT